MRVSRVTILVLSMLLYFLTQAGGKLSGKGLAAEANHTGAAISRKHLKPSRGGDPEVEGRKPSPRWWKAAAAAATQIGDRAHGKASSDSQLGTSKQKPSGKRQFLSPSPPKSKSRGLEAHLEGHGKFNTDMYSCPGIQLKACRKPSDCDGCLGFYTCKLPKGKCDFKAVSRPTGSFSRSIQER